MHHFFIGQNILQISYQVIFKSFKREYVLFTKHEIVYLHISDISAQKAAVSKIFPEEVWQTRQNDTSNKISNICIHKL